MRRITLVLTAAALMAAMVASASPAWANNTGDFTNQQGFISVGNDWGWWSDDDYYDHWGWWSGGDGISFTIGDSENESGDITFTS